MQELLALLEFVSVLDLLVNKTVTVTYSEDSCDWYDCQTGESVSTEEVLVQLKRQLCDWISQRQALGESSVLGEVESAVFDFKIQFKQANEEPLHTMVLPFSTLGEVELFVTDFLEASPSVASVRCQRSDLKQIVEFRTQIDR